jgi:phage shock protein PspC (stress-responsive transcriptional regulator)
MKQVININFQGRVVPIEVTAFEILKGYTESLNRYFANEEGKEEIINDIESRIGELFQERLKSGSTCITDDDVNAIIRSMGRPEDFETEENISGTAEKAKATADTSSVPPLNNMQANKRLHRDENDKVIGGVCSGLANYFGIDVILVRIIFVVLAVSFGFGLITYLILWVAVPSSALTDIGGVRKKLYRDSDDKIIAGVCSGIGNYFGVNAWIPRVLFLLPFLGFISGWGHWGGDFPGFLRVGFSPGALIIYIILWLVIPEAFSTTEKLEMKGEKVDMNSIKNSVMEEMKGVQQRAEKFTREAKTFAQERGQTFTAEATGVARRSGRSLGDIIVLIFKIFAYFILGCIGFSFVVGLFAFGIAAVGIFPMKDFVLTEGWQNIFAWGTLIFFIAAPIIGIITWIVRKLAKIKSNRKTMRLSFSALWLIGLFSFIALLVSVGRDFKSLNSLNEQDVSLSNPTVSKLEITSVSPDQKFYRNRWFRMEPFEGLDEDTAMLQNVSIHIVKSPNDSFRVTMLKMVNGRTKRYADTLAGLMQFNAIQKDSLLVIDKGIAITRKDKFRNQRIVLTVYVPVGKQIRINRNVGWGGGNISFGPWSDNEWNIDFEDLENGWDHDVDYVMKADGLYDLNGKPADEYKHPQKEDNDENDAEKDRARQQKDSNGVNMNNDVYRYNNNVSPAQQTADTLKQKMLKDLQQQQLKDSLERIKNNIDKQLEKLGDKATKNNEDQTISYSIPAYNPLLIMN